MQLDSFRYNGHTTRFCTPTNATRAPFDERTRVPLAPPPRELQELRGGYLGLKWAA